MTRKATKPDDVAQNMELAHRSTSRMMRMTSLSRDADPRQWRTFMARESALLLRRAFGLWWSLRRPWRRHDGGG